MLLSGGEAVITGTVVCGTVIAAAADHGWSIAQLCVAIVVSVSIFFIAHVHAQVLGSAIAHGHHPLAVLRQTVLHNLPMLVASLLPLLVLVVTALFGATQRTAAIVALGATTALLAIYSFLAAHRAGTSRLEQVVSAMVGLAIGLLVIALKTALK